MNFNKSWPLRSFGLEKYSSSQVYFYQVEIRWYRDSSQAAPYFTSPQLNGAEVADPCLFI